MKRAIAMVSGLALILSLAACGDAASNGGAQPGGTASAGAPTTAPSSPTPTESSPTDAAAPGSAEAFAEQHGHKLKKWGEEAGITDPMNDGVLVKWTLTNPQFDIQCDAQMAEAPKNGHYVSLDATVETSRNYDKDHSEGFDISYGWKYYLKDGTVFNGPVDSGSYQAFGCLQENEKIRNLYSGEKGSGKIVFDLPTTDGTLAYEYDGVGWEYPLQQ